MIVELWMATAAANGIIAVIYGAISVTMIREAILGRQWWQNPLLTATVAIFVTCTIGHGMHMAHAVLDTWGASDHAAVIGHATRATFVDERLLIWDSVTAFVAVWYWGLRTRFAILFHGAALCEDMVKRQQEAAQIHDNVVQGLAEAKLALDLGRREEGRQAIVETLKAAKRISSSLLGRPGQDVVAFGVGDLRRSASPK